MPEVWFTRHGECTANVGAATRNAWEAMLTARGHEQARRIAAYLSHKVDDQSLRIITSSYERARQTALPTSLFFKEASFEVWPQVQEFDYLSLPANMFTTAFDRSSLVQEFWGRCSPSFQHGNKAESFNDFISRVQGVLQQLSEFQEDKLVVIFSHHQFIQAVKWLLKGGVKGSSPQPQEMNDFYQFFKNKRTFVPNGAIVKTYLSPMRQVVLACQTSHLASLPSMHGG